MRKLFLTTLTLFALAISGSVLGGIKVEDVQLSSKNGKQLLRINYNGDLNESLDWEIKDNVLQVVLPNTVVWPKIDKKVTVSRTNDTTLMAYQFNKDVARVRALLPYNLKGKEAEVQIIVKKNHLLIEFPGPQRIMTKIEAKKSNSVSKSIQNITEGLVKSEKNKTSDKYDEKLLDDLLRDSKKSNDNETLAGMANRIRAEKTAKDTVSVKMSSTKAAGKKSSWNEGFSLVGYFGKFIAFLGLVLLLFYGVVNLMKKGVFKKGKLSFLNKMNTVSVLTTTYLAPKKSVHVVKAHNQVFLIATSEKGVHFLSELEDASSIMKNGELDVAGNNFDTTLDSNQNKDFKVKDILSDGTDAAPAANVTINTKSQKNAKKAKFSEQLKNKVKDLKPLQ